MAEAEANAAVGKAVEETVKAIVEGV